MKKMSKKQFNKRQDAILAFVGVQNAVSISQIVEYIHQVFDFDVAKITINRDVKKLVDERALEKKGAGRSTTYMLAELVQAPIDVDRYFEKDARQREIRPAFNFDVFSHMGDLFSDQEIQQLDGLKHQYQKKVSSLPHDVLQKEWERFTIELSWKSSQIEGNTYSLLQTEQLLKEHKEAAGHTKEEAVMILNHKKAVDHIVAARENFDTVTRQQIEDVHALIVQGMSVTTGLRSILVRITGTEYTPLDNVHQIREALDSACETANGQSNPFIRAFVLTVLIAYIQPFVDGNKRTSRLIGNAVLMAQDCPPLSYRSIDELEYKKAMLLFYEQNSAVYIKQLFIEQIEFSVENYFG